VRRRFGNDPSKVGMLAGAKSQPIKMRIRAAKAKGNWAHVLEVCEEAFVQNPWDVHVAWEAAEAAEHLELLDLAQWLMESVQAQAGNDANFFRYMAHIFQLQENWQKAIACWERVRKLAPTDENANRQINALSASASITRAGLGEAIERHKEAAGRAGPEPAAEPDAEALRRKQMTPEQRFEQEIREHPEGVGPTSSWPTPTRRTAAWTRPATSWPAASRRSPTNRPCWRSSPRSRWPGSTRRSTP
jgi:tetratricopeptide (TPR) repeat protein